MATISILTVILCLTIVEVKTEADASDYPYTVAIVSPNEERRPSYKLLCSGAIIGDRWVIISSNCFRGDNAKRMIVVTGSNQIFRVTDRWLRPSYNNPFDKREVAIIKIRGRFAFGQNIQPVQLPAKDEEYPFGVVNATGFIKNQSRLKLIASELDIVPDIRCRRVFSLYFFFNLFNSNNQICAGHFLERRSDEELDPEYSVGPILVKNGHLIGISPSNQRMEHDYSNIPFLYSKVALHVDWITEIMNN